MNILISCHRQNLMEYVFCFSSTCGRKGNASVVETACSEKAVDVEAVGKAEVAARFDGKGGG
jgi:hypothetical protein